VRDLVCSILRAYDQDTITHFGRATGGNMKHKAALATVNRVPFVCQVCQGEYFFDREVKLNSTGMEFFDLGWANQSATGLICGDCGYVHLFVGKSVELWKAEGGYPQR